MVRSRSTLLRQLISQRRLTREQTIEVLNRRAELMRVRDFALSVRQLDRWLAGDVVTLPRPSMCRVIEEEFGQPVERLFAITDNSPARRDSARPGLPTSGRSCARRRRSRRGSGNGRTLLVSAISRSPSSGSASDS